MVAAERRNLRLVVTLLLLTCGVLVSVTLDKGEAEQRAWQGPYTVLDAPTFTVELGRGYLLLTTTTESIAHETGLSQIVAEQFGDYSTETSFRAGVGVSEAWANTSNRLLYALAATDSVSATMRDHNIDIRGVTSDAATYRARIAILREDLPDNMNLAEDIIVVDVAATLESLCRRTFGRITRTPIAFRQSSAEIRTASYPLLDKLIDFAYDCQDLTIAITGHSDASGDAAWNLYLSQARAQAVADYLVRGGIVADRLIVAGRGSSVPIADNTTAHGRSRNRRIEIELR